MPRGARIQGGDQRIRRRSPRRAVQAPVDVTVLRSGVPDTVPGRVVDLSAGGLAAVLARELLPGESVGVEIQLPDSSRLRTRALVRYHDKLRCGMEFISLSADQMATIYQFAKEPGAELDLPSTPPSKPPAGALPAIRPATPGKPGAGSRAAKREEPKTAGPKSGESSSVGSTSVGSTSVGSTITRSTSTASTTAASKRPAPQAVQALSPSRRRGWIFLMGSLAILVSVLWWRWDRGWQDLEAGLHSTTLAVQPEAQISADVMQGLVTHRVDPEYPESARQANLQGIVVLDIIIGREGAVLSVKPVSGPDIFIQPAIDALRWWRFRPYRVNGQAVIVETTIAVEFKP
jgi:TonB family protein